MDLPSLEELQSKRNAKKAYYNNMGRFSKPYLKLLKETEEELTIFISEHPHMLEPCDIALSSETHSHIRLSIFTSIIPFLSYSLYSYKFSSPAKWYIRYPSGIFLAIVPPFFAMVHSTELYARLHYYLLDKYTPRYSKYLITANPSDFSSD
jgi:hypothetical protein